MGPEEIKPAIEITAKNGDIGDKGDEITYTGSKLDGLPVDEMTVIRTPESGNIIAAFLNVDR